MAVRGKTENQRKAFVSLILSTALILIEILAALLGLKNRWAQFCSFAVDCNYLLLFATIIWAICIAGYLRDGIQVPRWVHVANYVAVSAALLSSMATIVLLLTKDAYICESPLTMTRCCYYIVCPLLATVDFCAFRSRAELEVQDNHLTLLPEVAYGLAALIMNLYGVWNGPYQFLQVLTRPPAETVVWIVALCCGAWLLALILRLVNRVVTREYVF